MKFFLTFSFLLLIDASSASPILTQSDTEPLLEISKINEDVKYRWVQVPDSEGKMYLVDLNTAELTPEPAFDPDNDIIYTLFTRLNPTVGQVISRNLASVQNSNFNPNHPTRFTLHGWNGGAGGSVNSAIRQAYFQLGDYNMITVDWSAGAVNPNYITARNQVGPAGRSLGRFIDFLHLNNFVQFSTLHVIGHSLGGHAAGFAGKEVTRGRIQVIYALDPAGPLFQLNDPDNRVSENDGVYVEIMHTNGGTLGFREPIGHASFFPNFGQSQPGCGVDVGGGCAHGRCIPLYAESINSVFTATECQSFEEIDNNQCTPTGRTAPMAGAVGNINLRGNFYLETNAQSPFSMG